MLSQEGINRICEEKKSGKSQRETAKYIGVSEATVRKIAHERCPSMVKPVKTPKEVKELMFKLYEKGTSIRCIAKETNVCYATAKKIIRSVYPSEYIRTEKRNYRDITKTKDCGEFKNPRGLNEPMKKLKDKLKIGDKVAVAGCMGEVVEIYKHFFVVRKKGVKESFLFSDFLIGKGKIYG